MPMFSQIRVLSFVILLIFLLSILWSGSLNAENDDLAERVTLLEKKGEWDNAQRNVTRASGIAFGLDGQLQTARGAKKGTIDNIILTVILTIGTVSLDPVDVTSDLAASATALIKEGKNLVDANLQIAWLEKVRNLANGDVRHYERIEDTKKQEYVDAGGVVEDDTPPSTALMTPSEIKCAQGSSCSSPLTALSSDSHIVECNENAVRTRSNGRGRTFTSTVNCPGVTYYCTPTIACTNAANHGTATSESGSDSDSDSDTNRCPKCLELHSPAG